MMKIFLTIGMLVISNIFMTLAWYGHLKMREFKWFDALPVIVVILISWGIALFEDYFVKQPHLKLNTILQRVNVFNLSNLQVLDFSIFNICVSEGGVRLTQYFN
jgi:uncharacterized protein (DUF486 family)